MSIGLLGASSPTVPKSRHSSFQCIHDSPSRDGIVQSLIATSPADSGTNAAVVSYRRSGARAVPLKAPDAAQGPRCFPSERGPLLGKTKAVAGRLLAAPTLNDAAGFEARSAEARLRPARTSNLTTASKGFTILLELRAVARDDPQIVGKRHSSPIRSR
jgi:hypothetical protein